MSLTSDITIAAAKFAPSAISDQANSLNNQLIEKLGAGPKWFEVGAPKYREMRLKGQTPIPPAPLLPQALDITIPSREPGRNIPCRLIYPAARQGSKERKQCKGTVCHFHGGGWTLGDEKSTDSLLQIYADAGDLAVISVGYRLAPEDPFPAGPHDCTDSAEYLVSHSEQEYGGPLRFIGGESAGAHLSALVGFHLLKTNQDFRLAGLLLHFGCFDLTSLPQVHHFSKPLILDREIIGHFLDAFVPGMTLEQRRDASVSPLYEDMEKLRGRLPSALFTCGTEDPLLDDTMMMSTKWLMKGGEAIVKIYPGAPHAFIAFPAAILKEAGQALEDTKAYIRERLAES